MVRSSKRGRWVIACVAVVVAAASLRAELPTGAEIHRRKLTTETLHRANKWRGNRNLSAEKDFGSSKRIASPGRLPLISRFGLRSAGLASRPVQSVGSHTLQCLRPACKSRVDLCVLTDTSRSFPVDEGLLPVRLPPKNGASLEHPGEAVERLGL